MMKRIGLWVATIVLCTSTLTAQSDPNRERGFDPEKLYQFNNIDQVSLQSGMLNIASLPIFPNYPIGGSMSLSIPLSYSSGIWELSSFMGQPRMVLNELQNAGAGWRVGFGLLLAPGDPANPTGASRWVYVAEDQGTHEFWSSLHQIPGCGGTGDDCDGDSGGTVDYSRDGSYLRLRRNVATNIHEVDFGNGTIRRFAQDPSLTTRYRVVQIRDGFTTGGVPDNAITIDYGTSGVWKVKDPYLREQRVYFRNAPRDGATVQVVDRIEVTAFGDETATYNFEYFGEDAGWFNLRRDCIGPAGGDPDLTAPMLKRVLLPDGTAWSMEYWNEVATSECRRGQLERIVLPTGGRIEYVYSRVFLPTPNGCWNTQDFSGKVLAIYRRRVVDGVASPNPFGDWTYGFYTDQEPNLPNPCDSGDPFLEWASQLRVQVTPPGGHLTEHYFSVWAFLGPATPAGFLRKDYGLPISRLEPTSGGRFLSSRVFDCTGGSPCEPFRSEYVTYEDDAGASSGVLSATTQKNRRLRGSRTVFHDDLVNGAPRYADSSYERFDGVGNFRRVILSGNFDRGNERTTVTEFNPGLLDYPNASYDLIDFTAPWILGTYNSVTTTEGVGSAHSAKKEFQFSSTTGFLECMRTLKSEASRSTNGDLLVKYTAGLRGHVVKEESFGGDRVGQTLGIGSVCASANATPEYTIQHAYAAGSRKSSQVLGVLFKSLDQEIDLSTGLPSLTRDSSGLEAVLDYDDMGRLISIDPQATAGIVEEAWTELTYDMSTLPRRVTARRCRQSSATCSDANVLSEVQTLFDGQGRIYRERRKGASGAMSRRVHLHDSSGREVRTTSWVPDSGPSETSLPATITSNFDPLDRPLSRTLPDGSTVDFGYVGAAWVETETSIATWPGGVPNGEERIVRWEGFDRQGRLWRVEEQARPGSVPQSFSGTEYRHDEGNRLIEVCQDTSGPPGAPTGCGQTRTFGFDDRGFLTEETHPEKVGRVCYLGYSSRGLVERKVDPTGSACSSVPVEGQRDLLFSYDAAERLTQVQNGGAGGSILKQFFYDSDPDPAPPLVDFGRSNGKRVISISHNHVAGLNVQVKESHFYFGINGRLSERATETDGTADDNLFEQGWEYGPLGEVTRIHYPEVLDGAWLPDPGPQPRALNQTYSNGFLTGISGFGSISYHPNLTVAQITHTNGVTESIAADPHGMARPASISTTGVDGGQNWTSGPYAFDGAGNAKAIGDDRYRYDKVSRLREARMHLVPGNGGTQYTQMYTFDAFGNLTAVAGHEAIALATSSSTNRLTAGGAAYDGAGNLTSWSGNSYVFDRLNRMNERTTAGANSRHWYFIYSADDERVWSIDVNLGEQRLMLRDFNGKALREYAYEPVAVGGSLTPTGSGNLVPMACASNPPHAGVFCDGFEGGTTSAWALPSLFKMKDWIYRGTQLLAADELASGTTRFHLDHLGSPRQITGEIPTGAFVGRHAYLPFGGELPGGTSDRERLKFTGHERDLSNFSSAADDVDYMMARSHSPVLGRFLSTDPVRGLPTSPQSWNRFGYALGNPILYVDQDGRQPERYAGLMAQYVEDPGMIQRDMQSSALAVTGVAALGIGGATFGLVTQSGLAAELGAAFGLYGTTRGDAIEKILSRAFGGGLPRSFPVIDRFLNGVATSVKSLDLSAKSYQNAARLSSTLDRFVDKLARFSGGQVGDVAVRGGDISSRVLEVVVQSSKLTEAQAMAIMNATRRAAEMEITLRVVGAR